MGLYTRQINAEKKDILRLISEQAYDPANSIKYQNEINADVAVLAAYEAQNAKQQSKTNMWLVAGLVVAAYLVFAN
jgi:hypothetical protein